MAGKKFQREEWEAAIKLRQLGRTASEIQQGIGRSGNGHALVNALNKYNDDYDEYLANYKSGKIKGKRKTEQLQFVPPVVQKPAKKIEVKRIVSSDEWRRYKVEVAVRNFMTELKDAGLRF